MIAESFIEYEREVAVTVVRDLQGNCYSYPVVDTIQENNICNVVLAPAQISEAVAEAIPNLFSS